MTIFASEAAAAATPPPDEQLDARDQVMHALALLETITALLPTMAFHLDVNNYSTGFDGRHGARVLLPTGTTDFGGVQEQLGGLVTLEIDSTDRGDSRRLMLSGVYFGVPFQVSAMQFSTAPAVSA